MFSVEVKINGILIGHLYGHNKGYMESDDLSDECLYSYEWFEPGTGKEVKRGNITHKRDDGMVKLLSKIFKKLEK